MSMSVAVMSGVHAGMNGRSLLVLLGTWAIIGILALVVKSIISSLYPEKRTEHINLNEDKILTDIKLLKKSVSAKDFSEQNFYDFPFIISLLITKKIDGYKKNGIWYIKYNKTSYNKNIAIELW